MRRRVEITVPYGGENRDAPAAVRNPQYWWPDVGADRQSKLEASYKVFLQKLECFGGTSRSDEELRLMFGRYCWQYYEYSSAKLAEAARYVADGGELENHHNWDGFGFKARPKHYTAFLLIALLLLALLLITHR